LIELRRADVADRLGSKKGRGLTEEVRAIKARLWAQIIGGVDLSPEVAAALLYVDVAERVARLIGGGWVRDAGETLYASSADPRVVALMVASAKAKGWTAVRVFGDAAFIAEATRQFGAAGIVVSTGDDPPPSVRIQAPAGDTPPASRAQIEAIFSRRLEAEQARLERLASGPDELPNLNEAIEAERAEGEAYRQAKSAFEAARSELERAKTALAEASFFERRSLQKHRDVVAARFASARAERDARLAALNLAASGVSHLQQRRERDLRRFWERNGSAWDDAVRERDFARACIDTLEAAPELFNYGTEAIERATRARIDSERDAQLAELNAQVASDVQSSP
jgi:hypothetical protein